MPTLRLVGSDARKGLAFEPGRSVGEVLGYSVRALRYACGGTGACGLCRVRVVAGERGRPTEVECARLSVAELRAGLRLACQFRPSSDVVLEPAGQSPSTTWLELPGDELAPWSGREHPVRPMRSGGRSRGVAVDLGSTQIRIALWDLAAGRRLGTRYGYNPQAARGADVLARLEMAAESPQGATEMTWLARGAIGDALADLAPHGGGTPDRIDRVVVVGNTAMLLLLAGGDSSRLLDPDNWSLVLDCELRDTVPWHTAWGLAGDAVIHLMPSLAGFVGSDFTAAVLATDLMGSDGPALLLDVGTNAEIGLWDGSRLWVTSAPGGPAFQGSGLSRGMPAEPGAIHKVEYEVGHGFVSQVIGDRPARGLCGSGVVDAIACARRAGLVGAGGGFRAGTSASGIRLSEGDDPVVLLPRDLDVVMRAKAAIAAGTSCLLDRAHVAPSDLVRLCVCGAFGRDLDIDNAQSIGLLPVIAPDRIELHSNAALAGCEQLLGQDDPAASMERIRILSRPVNLAMAQEFEERFIHDLRLEPQSHAPRDEMRAG